MSASASSNGTGGSGGSGVAWLEPTPEFHEFFLNPSLVALLFRCYVLARDDADTAHSVIQSIIQLSTLSGSIFRTPLHTTGDELQSAGADVRSAFFANFVQCFVSTFAG